MLQTLDPISNTATWNDTYQFLDEDGEPLDISAATAITLKLREPKTDAIVLTGSLGTELALVSGGTTGFFEWTFSADAMSGIDPKTYEVGGLITISGQTSQYILGNQPVLKGL